MLKSISLILALFLLGQDLTFANPEIGKILLDLRSGPDTKEWVQKTLPAIPASAASVEDSWKGTGSKTLILLQDAHTNISGQLNLARTLDILAGHLDLKHVFLEAGEGNESLSRLRPYASLSQRQQTAKSYLLKGQLQGSEYADLTSEHSFALWGVEDMELYGASLASYRAVAEKREKYKDYLDRVTATAEILKADLFNPFLLAFDQKRQKFLKSDLSLTDYFSLLTEQAQILRISLDRYPALKDLSRLRQMESGIDFKAASQQEEKALFSLSAHDQKELLQAHQDTLKVQASQNNIQAGYFFLLSEKLASSLAEYPQLSKYLDYLKASKSLDLEKALEEEKILTEQIYQALSESADEKNLLLVSKNIKALKDLLDLQMTPRYFEDYQKDKNSFDMARMTGFLNLKLLEKKDHYDKALFLESGYEDVIKNSEEFYLLTDRRDAKFIENIQKQMKEDIAVLITGGYHSWNLKNLLKQKNISYIVLTPQVLEETNLKRYEELLLNQKQSSLPAVPSNPSVHTLMNQRIMAYDPWGNKERFGEDLFGGQWPLAKEVFRGQREGGEAGTLSLAAARLAEEKAGTSPEPLPDFSKFKFAPIPPTLDEYVTDQNGKAAGTFLQRMQGGVSAVIRYRIKDQEYIFIQPHNLWNLSSMDPYFKDKPSFWLKALWWAGNKFGIERWQTTSDFGYRRQAQLNKKDHLHRFLPMFSRYLASLEVYEDMRRQGLGEKEGFPEILYLPSAEYRQRVLKLVQYAWIFLEKNDTRRLNKALWKLKREIKSGKLFFVEKPFPSNSRNFSELLAGGGVNLDMEAIFKLIFLTIQKIQVLHSNGILHSDIKPDNIQIVLEGLDMSNLRHRTVSASNIKDILLVDYGFSLSTKRFHDPNTAAYWVRYLENALRVIAGTPGYFPEYAYVEMDTLKRDLASFWFTVGNIFGMRSTDDLLTLGERRKNLIARLRSGFSTIPIDWQLMWLTPAVGVEVDWVRVFLEDTVTFNHLQIKDEEILIYEHRIASFFFQAAEYLRKQYQPGGARLASNSPSREDIRKIVAKESSIRRILYTLGQPENRGTLTELIYKHREPGMGEILSRMSKVREGGQYREIAGEVFAADWVAENVPGAKLLALNTYLRGRELDAVFVIRGNPDLPDGVYIVEAKEDGLTYFDGLIGYTSKYQVSGQIAAADSLRDLGIPIYHLVAVGGPNAVSPSLGKIQPYEQRERTNIYSLVFKFNVSEKNPNVAYDPEYMADKNILSLTTEANDLYEILSREYPVLEDPALRAKLQREEFSQKQIRQNSFKETKKKIGKMTSKVPLTMQALVAREAAGWISSFQRIEAVGYETEDVQNAVNTIELYFRYMWNEDRKLSAARQILQKKFQNEEESYRVWDWLSEAQYQNEYAEGGAVKGARLTEEDSQRPYFKNHSYLKLISFLNPYTGNILLNILYHSGLLNLSQALEVMYLEHQTVGFVKAQKPEALVRKKVGPYVFAEMNQKDKAKGVSRSVFLTDFLPFVGRYQAFAFLAPRLLTRAVLHAGHPGPSQTCPLCEQNMPVTENPFEWKGRFSYNIAPNPFPILNSPQDRHFVIAQKKHTGQALDPERLKDLISVALELGPGYTVFKNGRGAGATIPDHDHTQILTYALPIQDESHFPPALLASNRGVESYSLKNYPRSVRMLRARDRDSLAREAWGTVIEAFEKNNVPYDVELAVQKDGAVQLYVQVLDPGRASRFVGAVQASGYLAVPETDSAGKRVAIFDQLDPDNFEREEEAKSRFDRFIRENLLDVEEVLEAVRAARLAKDETDFNVGPLTLEERVNYDYGIEYLLHKYPQARPWIENAFSQYPDSDQASSVLFRSEGEAFADFLSDAKKKNAPGYPELFQAYQNTREELRDYLASRAVSAILDRKLEEFLGFLPTEEEEDFSRALVHFIQSEAAQALKDLQKEKKLSDITLREALPIFLKLQMNQLPARNFIAQRMLYRLNEDHGIIAKNDLLASLIRTTSDLSAQSGIQEDPSYPLIELFFIHEIFSDSPSFNAYIKSRIGARLAIDRSSYKSVGSVGNITFMTRDGNADFLQPKEASFYFSDLKDLMGMLPDLSEGVTGNAKFVSYIDLLSEDRVSISVFLSNEGAFPEKVILDFGFKKDTLGNALLTNAIVDLDRLQGFKDPAKRREYQIAWFKDRVEPWLRSKGFSQITVNLLGAPKNHLYEKSKKFFAQQGWFMVPGNERSMFKNLAAENPPAGARLASSVGYYSQTLREVLIALDLTQNPNDKTKFKAIRRLRQLQESGRYRKDDRGRFAAPIEIIIGHLKNSQFYPKRKNGIIYFFLRAGRADVVRITRLLLLAYSKERFYGTDGTGIQDGRAVLDILLGMIRIASADKNPDRFELIKNTIQEEAASGERDEAYKEAVADVLAQLSAGARLAGLAPDPDDFYAKQIKDDFARHDAYLKASEKALRDLLAKAPYLGEIRQKVTRVIYPAGFYDRETVLGFLRTFPNIKKVYIVDPQLGSSTIPSYQGTLKEFWIKPLLESAQKQGVPLDPQISFEILEKNYYDITPQEIPRLGPDQYTVVIEKAPGHDGGMRAESEFPKKILEQTHPGDVVFALPAANSGLAPILRWKEDPIAVRAAVPLVYLPKYGDPHQWTLSKLSEKDFVQGARLAEIRKEITVLSPKGLHFRPVHKIIEAAAWLKEKYGVSFYLMKSKGETRFAEADSMMEMIGLTASRGSKLILKAEAPQDLPQKDLIEAMDVFSSLVGSPYLEDITMDHFNDKYIANIRRFAKQAAENAAAQLKNSPADRAEFAEYLNQSILMPLQQRIQEGPTSMSEVSRKISDQVRSWAFNRYGASIGELYGTDFALPITHRSMEALNASPFDTVFFDSILFFGEPVSQFTPNPDYEAPAGEEYSPYVVSAVYSPLNPEKIQRITDRFAAYLGTVSGARLASESGDVLKSKKELKTLKKAADNLAEQAEIFFADEPVLRIAYDSNNYLEAELIKEALLQRGFEKEIQLFDFDQKKDLETIEKAEGAFLFVESQIDRGDQVRSIQKLLKMRKISPDRLVYAAFFAPSELVYLKFNLLGLASSYEKPASFEKKLLQVGVYEEDHPWVKKLLVGGNLDENKLPQTSWSMVREYSAQTDFGDSKSVTLETWMKEAGFKAKDFETFRSWGGDEQGLSKADGYLKSKLTGPDGEFRKLFALSEESRGASSILHGTTAEEQQYADPDYFESVKAYVLKEWPDWIKGNEKDFNIDVRHGGYWWVLIPYYGKNHDKHYLGKAIKFPRYPIEDEKRSRVFHGGPVDLFGLLRRINENTMPPLFPNTEWTQIPGSGSNSYGVLIQDLGVTVENVLKNAIAKNDFAKVSEVYEALIDYQDRLMREKGILIVDNTPWNYLWVEGRKGQKGFVMVFDLDQANLLNRNGSFQERPDQSFFDRSTQENNDLYRYKLLNFLYILEPILTHADSPELVSRFSEAIERSSRKKILQGPGIARNRLALILRVFTDLGEPGPKRDAKKQFLAHLKDYFGTLSPEERFDHENLNEIWASLQAVIREGTIEEFLRIAVQSAPGARLASSAQTPDLMRSALSRFQTIFSGDSGGGSLDPWAQAVKMEESSFGKDVSMISFDPEKFLSLLPADRKPSRVPYKIFYIFNPQNSADAFESLVAIFGDTQEPGFVSPGDAERSDLIVADGNLEYFSAEKDADDAALGALKEKRKELSFIPLNAMTADDLRKGASFLNGAAMQIVAKPGANKKNVLEQWSRVLGRSNILGTHLAASIGQGLNTGDMDGILLHASLSHIDYLMSAGEMKFFRGIWQKVKIRLWMRFSLFSKNLRSPILSIVRPAVGVSEIYGGIPRYMRNIGDGIATAMVGLGRNKYIRRVFFSQEYDLRSENPLRVGFFGYTSKSAAVTTSLMDGHVSDTGLEIHYIVDLENDKVLSDVTNKIPSNFLREINTKVMDGKPWMERASRKLSDSMEIHLFERGAVKGPAFYIPEANILVLDSRPRSFTARHVESFHGEIVIEAAPNVATQEAIDAMIKNKILFIPYSTANIARATLSRQEILNTMRGTKPSEVGEVQLSDQISERTLSNLYEVLEYLQARVPRDQQDSLYFSTVVSDLNTIQSDRLKHLADIALLGAPVPPEEEELSRKIDRRISEYLSYGVDYRLAVKIVVFEQAYAELFFSKIEQLKKELVSGDDMERRTAVYRLGSIPKDLLEDSQRHEIIDLIGNRLLRDPYYRVRAQAARALGRLEDIEDPARPAAVRSFEERRRGGKETAQDYLKKAYFNPEQTDPSVREWIKWSMKHLKMGFAERIPSFEAEVKAKTKEVEAHVKRAMEKAQRKADAQGVPVEAVSDIQGPLLDLTKIEFQLGCMYYFEQDLLKAQASFKKAIQHGIQSEIEGGILPIHTQWNIAAIYYEMSQNAENSQNFYEAHSYESKAKDALLELLIGGEFNDTSFLLSPGSGYFKISLYHFLQISGIPYDRAQSLAGAINMEMNKIGKDKLIRSAGPYPQKVDQVLVYADQIKDLASDYGVHPTYLKLLMVAISGIFSDRTDSIFLKEIRKALRNRLLIRQISRGLLPEDIELSRAEPAFYREIVMKILDSEKQGARLAAQSPGTIDLPDEYKDIYVTVPPTGQGFGNQGASENLVKGMLTRYPGVKIHWVFFKGQPLDPDVYDRFKDLGVDIILDYSPETPLPPNKVFIYAASSIDLPNLKYFTPEKTQEGGIILHVPIYAEAAIRLKDNQEVSTQSQIMKSETGLTTDSYYIPTANFSQENSNFMLNHSLYQKSREVDGWTAEQVRQERRKTLESLRSRGISAGAESENDIWAYAYYFNEAVFEEYVQAVSGYAKEAGKKVTLFAVPNKDILAELKGTESEKLELYRQKILGVLTADSGVQLVILPNTYKNRDLYLDLLLYSGRLDAQPSGPERLVNAVPNMITGDQSWGEAISSQRLFVHDGTSAGLNYGDPLVANFWNKKMAGFIGKYPQFSPLDQKPQLRGIPSLAGVNPFALDEDYKKAVENFIHNNDILDEIARVIITASQTTRPGMETPVSETESLKNRLNAVIQQHPDALDPVRRMAKNMLQKMDFYSEDEDLARMFNIRVRTFLERNSGARLALSSAALGLVEEDKDFFDLYEKMSGQFPKNASIRARYGAEGLKTAALNIEYDYLFDVYVVEPTEETLKDYPELSILKLSSTQDDIGRPGSFGNIRVKFKSVDGKTVAVIDEIHPSRGYRKLRPSTPRNFFRQWMGVAVEEMRKALSDIGVTEIYVSSPERIGERYKKQQIPQASLWENYQYSFSHGGWQKVRVSFKGEPDAVVWKKNEGARLAVKNIDLSVEVRRLADLGAEKYKIDPKKLILNIAPEVLLEAPDWDKSSQKGLRDFIWTVLKDIKGTAEISLAVSPEGIFLTGQHYYSTGFNGKYDDFFAAQKDLVSAGGFVRFIPQEDGAKATLYFPKRPGIVIKRWDTEEQIQKINDRYADKSFGTDGLTASHTMAAFDFKKLREELGTDLGNEEVVYLGPYNNVRDLESFVQVFPGIKRIRFVEYEKQSVAVIEEWARDHRSRFPGQYFPEIEMYRTTLLDMSSSMEPGSAGFLFDKYVFGYFHGTKTLAKAASEIKTVLRSGGLHVSAGFADRFPGYGSDPEMHRQEYDNSTVFEKIKPFRIPKPRTLGARLTQTNKETLLDQWSDLLASINRAMDQKHSAGKDRQIIQTAEHILHGVNDEVVEEENYRGAVNALQTLKGKLNAETGFENVILYLDQGVRLLEDYMRDRSSSDEGAEGARLSFLGESGPEETVVFLTKVFKATGRTGKIAIGSRVYEYTQDPDNSLRIHDFREGADKVISPEGYREISSQKERSADLEISLSLSDFKMLFENSNQAVEKISFTQIREDLQATVEIDLDSLKPGQKGFQEVLVPFLIEEMESAHRQGWGKEARFLLSGSEEVKASVMKKVEEYFKNKNKTQDFIYAEESSINGLYTSRKALLTAAADPRPIRRAYLSSPQEGEFPNFRLGLRQALAEARIEGELLATNPQVMELVSNLKSLGIAITDVQEFIEVISSGAVQDSRIQKYALPPIVRLALDQALKAANLIQRMAAQSA